jgi:iron complex transport system substrate-binding protein
MILSYINLYTRSIVTLCVYLTAIISSAKADTCERIVTLAPSITESVFALGLGSNVVGVSKYSYFPEAARSIQVVGALFDPNIELIVSLKPSIVLMPKELPELARRLLSLGIKTSLFDFNSISSTLEAINQIGALCQVLESATALTDSIRNELEQLKISMRSLATVKTLVIVAESSDDGTLASFYCSGKDGFYNDLLQVLGATNVYPGLTGALGRLSTEGLLKLDPDAIIKIAPINDPNNVANSANSINTDLGILNSLKAAKSGRITVLSQDFMVVPGPRIVLAAKELARALHPEYKSGL